MVAISIRLGKSRGWHRIRAQTLHAEPAEHDEDHERCDLRYRERWLLLSGREGVEEGDFHERLRNADEAVEPACRSRSHHVDPPPGAGEAEEIQPRDREREQHE